ncbi:hypothetical protein ACQKEF_22255 [Pseudomonas oryzihabitans]|uniref:hypothetical protein n=1 Tax=Pseudomonas oryzihabitans TaxID=47885 RepID=UPI001643815E|nr:hypothetical protein [Pseudomonas oryzihabitans]
MTTKSPLEMKLAPESSKMGQPVALSGRDIDIFSELHDLQLAELCNAFGVNSSALYTQRSSNKTLNPSVAMLLRLFSAFPECIPRIDTPDPEVLLAKIKSIDPKFRKSHFGPLLGMAKNSSFRLSKSEQPGNQKANQPVRILMWLIDKLIDADPKNWFVIKDTVLIEAKAQGVQDHQRIFTDGRWPGVGRGKTVGAGDDDEQPEEPQPQRGNLVRRKDRRDANVAD